MRGLVPRIPIDETLRSVIVMAGTSPATTDVVRFVADHDATF